MLSIVAGNLMEARMKRARPHPTIDSIRWFRELLSWKVEFSDGTMCAEWRIEQPARVTVGRSAESEQKV